MDYEERSDRVGEIGDLYAGYAVYDMHYEKIGKVDDLFVNENDQPEYIGVKMGFLGLRSTLIPVEILRVNDKRRLVEVAADKDTIKDAPTFSDDEEITSELEERVYRHFGLQRGGGYARRGAYGAYYPDVTGDERVDLQPGERATEERRRSTGPGGTKHSGPSRHEGTDDRGFSEEDELRVQRSEEELLAGTREREAGSVNVRKRVRTDREQVQVPKKREEVHMKRVPVEGQRAAEDEIGDDEVRIPIVEEEIVVEKRPVVKEEIRLRKETVEDEEIIEEEVRKEEVDIDDQTTRRDR